MKRRRLTDLPTPGEWLVLATIALAVLLAFAFEAKAEEAKPRYTYDLTVETFYDQAGANEMTLSFFSERTCSEARARIEASFLRDQKVDPRFRYAISDCQLVRHG